MQGQPDYPPGTWDGDPRAPWNQPDPPPRNAECGSCGKEENEDDPKGNIDGWINDTEQGKIFCSALCLQKDLEEQGLVKDLDWDDIEYPEADDLEPDDHFAP